VFTKFIFFWIIIIIPFIAGKITEKQILKTSFNSEKLILFNLTFLEPPILFWSIWGLHTDKDTMLLPIIGFFSTFVSVFAVLPFLGILKHDKIKSETFKISAALSNQGLTMGSFICFLIIGEEGLGLAAIYTLYFLPLVFLILFPYAHYISSRYSNANIPGFSLKSTFISRRNIPVAAIIAALLLNYSGVVRPDIYFPTDILLSISISIYYFTLGTTFNYSDISVYKSEILVLSVLKFMIVPALTFIFISVLSLPENYEKIILIQSFMPAAIYSVVTSVLFHLDSKMTSTVFFTTNLIFISTILPLILNMYS